MYVVKKDQKQKTHHFQCILEKVCETCEQKRSGDDAIEIGMKGKLVSWAIHEIEDKNEILNALCDTI